MIYQRDEMTDGRLATLRRWAEQETLSTEQILSIADEAIRARVEIKRLREENNRLRVQLLELECHE